MGFVKTNAWALLAWAGLGCADPLPDTSDERIDTADPADTPPDPLVRPIAQGRLRGFEDGDSHAFLGIPYAAPPVDGRRFLPPAPALSWDGVREATAFGERCVQPARSFLDDDAEQDAFVGQEDCLTLNVWTPADATEAHALPVVVFVHGGGNTYGGASDPVSSLVRPREDRPLYDGSRLAAHERVVVVTPQYRLGALGYLSHPALDAESATGTSGNLGLRDQVAALEWVQENIEAFGGDPDRVLFMGQSGGGRDANALWTCNTPPGLFSAVAIHSAPLGLDDPEALRDRADALATELGCEGSPEEVAACFRAVPPEDLVLAEAATPLGLASAAFIPTVDGDLCTEQPRVAVSGGRYADVPVILGTMADEYSHRWTIQDAAYPKAVRAMVGPRFADQVLAQYPLERFESATVAFTEMMSDRNVTCPHRRYARGIAESGGTAHHYRFEQVLPEDVRDGYGAYHTTDFLYFFRHMDGEVFAVTPDDVATQDAMTGYWARFAATGSPSGGNDPAWPAYALDAERSLLVGPNPTIATDVKAEDCDFWDGLLFGTG